MVKNRHKFALAEAVYFLLVFTLVFVSTPGISVAEELIDGVQVVTFTTGQGDVNIYIPDDMAAGDTISAAVIAVPNGAAYEAQLNNLAILNKYVIEVNGQSFYVAGQSFTFTVPANMYGSNMKFTLREESRREYSSSTVPVKRRAYDVIRPEFPGPMDYKSPVIGQTGRSVEIEGPFDGDFRTTDLKIGGVDAEKLAESPRKLVVEAPPEIEGSTELQLTESQVVVKRPFTNLRVLKIGEDGAVPVSRFARRKDLTVNSGNGEMANSSSSEAPDAATDDFVPTQRLEFGSIGAEPVNPSTESSNPPGDKASIISAQMNAVLAYAAGNAPDNRSGDDILAVINTENKISSVKAPENSRRAQSFEVRTEDAAEVETDKHPPGTGNNPAGEKAPVKSAEEVNISADSDMEAASIELNHGKQEPAEFIDSVEKERIIEAQIYAMLAQPVLTSTAEKVNTLLTPEEILSSKGSYTIQVASFKNEYESDELAAKLRGRGYQSYVVAADIPGKGRWYRVRVGKFKSKREASSFGYKLKVNEPMVKDIFVALID